MPTTLNKTLKWTAIIGAFALLFTPLIVATSLFFPFITGKAFFFRIITEIIFGAWLTLAVVDPKYRPRRSAVLWAVLAFVGAMTLATIFSVNPSHSFWSNFERMEGLVTYLHLLGYFLVLSSVLSVHNLWQRFFQTSLGASVLVALYGLLQLFGLATINQGGVRLDSTFGNATYLAIYMVFHLFLATWLFSQSQVKWQKYLYGAVMVLETVILYFTATRGAILGLIAGAGLAALILAWRGSGRTQKVSRWLITGIIIVVIGFIAVRNVPLIQNNPVLGRFAGISLTERTTASRFLIWQMGWQGFKEHPLLGWGPENYTLVFNKYYNPGLWDQEQWFDRSHNLVFDWLIAGGLLGLLAYLSLYVAALWLIWRSHREIFEKSLFTGLLAAYFIHNLFVFDNIGSYLIFFALLAFFGSWSLVEEKSGRQLSLGVQATLGILAVILTIGLLLGFNLKPYLVNRELIKAITPAQFQTADQAVSFVNDHLTHFKQAINYNTFGNGEAREQLAQWTMQILNLSLVSDSLKKDLAAYTFEQLKTNIAANPSDARPLVFGALFLSNVNRNDLAGQYLKQALLLSPKKQSIMTQLAQVYAATGDLKDALQTAKNDFNLDQQNPAPRLLYAALLVYQGDVKSSDQLLLDGFGTTTVSDNLLLNTYIDAKMYNRVLAIWQLKVSQNPTDPQNWVSLAATYFTLGQPNQAVKVLEQAIAQIPSFKAEGEAYIQKIQAGQKP